jgi:hypothetical protein
MQSKQGSSSQPWPPTPPLHPFQLTVEHASLASSSTPTISSWPSRRRTEALIIPISDGEEEEQAVAAVAAAYSNLGGGGVWLELLVEKMRCGTTLLPR